MKTLLKYFSPMVCDPATGLLSPSKVWMNVAYIVVSYGFILETIKLGSVPAEKWLIYLAIVGTQSTASDFISLKYRQPSFTPQAPTDSQERNA